MDVIQAGFNCYDLENPMGERRKDTLRLNFDRKLKLEFHGTKVTSEKHLKRLFLIWSSVSPNLWESGRLSGAAEQEYTGLYGKSQLTTNTL
jgi:hypothetical protein